MGRKSSRDDILDAAERVIRRQGMAGTTIESVAAEAKVSKGGLFYHFASKKELLVQLLERYGQQFQTLRRQIYDQLPDDPNRLLKATILASCRNPARSDSRMSNFLSLLDDVDLRGKVLEMKRRVFFEITSGYPNPERVALAMLVTDGLWVMDLFGDETLSRDMREKIIKELLELIDQHADEKSDNIVRAN